MSLATLLFSLLQSTTVDVVSALACKVYSESEILDMHEERIKAWQQAKANNDKEAVFENMKQWESELLVFLLRMLRN